MKIVNASSLTIEVTSEAVGEGPLLVAPGETVDVGEPAESVTFDVREHGTPSLALATTVVDTSRPQTLGDPTLTDPDSRPR